MILTERIKDALSEILGIGIGRAADILNTMLDSHIKLTLPDIRLIRADEIKNLINETGSRLSAVIMRYSGSLDGTVELVFELDDASRIIDSLIGQREATADMDSLRAGTLCEVGNVVINAIIGTMANILCVELSFTVPYYMESSLIELLKEASVRENDMVLLARARFSIENLVVDGNIAIFFSMESFEKLSLAIERTTQG